MESHPCPSCKAVDRLSHWANHDEGCFVAMLLQHRTELQENLGDCIQELDARDEEIVRLNRIINQMIK